MAKVKSSGTLVREDIAKRMSAELGFSFRQAQRITNAVVAQMANELRKPNGKVKISGFGTFEAVVRKPRLGRNFQTGEPVRVAAARTVRLVPSRLLKATLNRGTQQPDD